MYYHQLKLSYNGKKYFGWQVQAETPMTIQGQILKAAQKINKSTNCKVQGASRTDAGVHALGQVCRLDLEVKLNNDEVVKALNSLLPDDIQVLEARPSHENFRPTSDAMWKEYGYYFVNEKSSFLSLQADQLTHYSYSLDFEKIRWGCKQLVGIHDFQNYYTVGSDINSTIREIFSCELIELEQGSPFRELVPRLWCLKIKGNGFLKQMVRLVIGSLWSLGRGKIGEEEFLLSLERPLPQKLGAVAPAQGLYLLEIAY